MDVRKLICAAALFLSSLTAHGQFYKYGDDPGGVRWSGIQTDSYRIIYPRTMDSLALQYALALEKYAPVVGRSIGFSPNQAYRKPMPVILHAFTSEANGMSVWTPRRLELRTVPDAYGPSPFPWITDLAIHESRHSAQMQYSNTGRLRIFGFLLGEMASGAMASLYGNQAFFEGDAVVAETALTHSGRARTADFLEYYRFALDHGDYRDYYKWYYGSIKNYTPTYYTSGYMFVAGMRTLYDDPLFSQRFYSNVFRLKIWPFPMFNMQYTVKQASGKDFRDTFREIEDYFLDTWRQEAAARAPFMPEEQVTPDARRHRVFWGTALAGDRLYGIRSGQDVTTQLVDLQTGRTLKAFAIGTGSLMWSDALGRLLWSETVPDVRWSLASTSRIRYYDPETGRTGDLTKKGRYFNPAPSPSDSRVAVTSYPYGGGSQSVILDGDTGNVSLAVSTPDSLQIVESAWIGNDVIISGISEAGFGLYNASKGFSAILEPRPVKIKQLRSRGAELLFVCDMNGVNELYCLDTATGELSRLTSTRYGASEFVFKGDSLYYSAFSAMGKSVFRTAISDLPRTKVDPSQYHRYTIEDKLSEQERALAPVQPASATVQPAKAYSKALHLLKIHSWAPVYVDYDSVSSISMDIFNHIAKPGAMVFFQNDLGTASGYAAYSYSKDSHGDPRHAAHLNFKYSGLYPVFEGTIHYNNSFSAHYNLYSRINGRYNLKGFKTTNISDPSFSGNLTVYIPLNFSKGGWSAGIIPQVRYTFSNSMYDLGVATFKYSTGFGPENMGRMVFQNKESGLIIPSQRVIASIRAYKTTNKARSGVYPHLGGGLELGVGSRIGLGKIFSPNVYASLYGYLPGLLPEHGIRLSALTQKHLDSGFLFNENTISCLPRGYSALASSAGPIAAYGTQIKFTADYSMAILPVDWSFLSPVAYIRNFILSPHADYAMYFNEEGSLQLCSVGADLSVSLGNLLWLPFDTEIGVSYVYNCGSGFSIVNSGRVPGRHYVGMIFNIDIQ